MLLLVVLYWQERLTSFAMFQAHLQSTSPVVLRIWRGGDVKENAIYDTCLKMVRLDPRDCYSGVLQKGREVELNSEYNLERGLIAKE